VHDETAAGLVTSNAVDEKLGQGMTDEEMNLAACALWRGILLADHSDFFSDCPRYIRATGHLMDKVPQPGFVGSKYRRGGLLLIGQNPGNDRVPHGTLSPADQEQYDLLTNLLGCSDDQAPQAFNALMTGLSESIMSKWVIYKNVVKPLLDGLDLCLERVAYTNLMKYHTTGSQLPKGLFRKAWATTERQLDLLAPGVIVCLGYGTASKFHSFYTGDARSYRIERHIGDTRLPPGGEADIAMISACERVVLEALYGE
jgi:hypothetical protein